MNKFNLKKSIKIFLILAVFSGFIIFSGTNETLAWHEDFDLNGSSGNFFWDRSASHSAELICDVSDPNHCKVPYALDLNSLANLGMSETDIINEIALAQTTINSMGLDMGVQFSAATALRDNIIIGEDMDFDKPAFYTGWRQCHGGATINGVCIGGTLDDHLGQITLKVNTDGNFFTFGTSEICPINDPTQWDLEKSLGHEMFHMMGLGHDPSDDSMVAGAGYICDRGEIPQYHDIRETLDKYGGDWVIGEDYTMVDVPDRVTEDSELENIMTVPENIIISDNSTLTINTDLTLDVNFTDFNITIESGSGLLVKNGSKVT